MTFAFLFFESLGLRVLLLQGLKCQDLSTKHHFPRALDLESIDPEAEDGNRCGQFR
jgi:hypothetical protein